MRRGALAFVLPLVLALAGCGRLPGATAEADSPARPEDVLGFHTLYSANCQACHGANGHNGPAMELGNPEYQALVDDATLRKWISGGMPGTEMPAFAQSAGGMLTDAQINAIIAGMRKEWARQNVFAGAAPPPYAQDQIGDAQRGQQTYQARCASCHEKPSRQQVASPAYLSLVSDQALRTIIVAGRADIGQPDWAHDNPRGASGASLSPQNVTDIVTYLGSLRNPAAVSATPLPVPSRR
ncbi:MAG: c-type cytochrome [Acidobacteriaceae bacterium]